MFSGAPIYNSLIKYIQENNIRLHMPGHIGGRGIKAQELVSMAGLDLTEVPGLDDLHCPAEAIEEARQKLADAYGAGESFFLVNGATAGIHSVMMGLCSENDNVLLPRNAHRSFFAAMVISGVNPVYCPVEIDAEGGFASAIREQSIEQIIKVSPEIKAAFICSPTYYGTCTAINKCTTILNVLDIPLVVDEAHGAHFVFNSEYPSTALGQGAIAAVNGLHKTLPVLNQGGCLHLASNCPQRNKIREAWSLLTTTSPSYPLLASIDLMRDFMEREGERWLYEAKKLSEEYKHKLNQLGGIVVYEREMDTTGAVQAIDPLKIVIILKNISLSGYQVAGILRKQYKIQVEMSEENLLVAMFSIFHQKNEWEIFYRAMASIVQDYWDDKIERVKLEIPPPTKIVLSPRQAFQAATKKIKLEEACGTIAGEMVIPYPPGIPCVLPGELIDLSTLEYLFYLRSNKIHIQGPEDKDLQYLNIIVI